MPFSLRGPAPTVNERPARGARLREQLWRWFDTPLGRSLQAVEAHHLRDVLPSLYGTVGLQVGRIGKLDLLDACAAPARVVLDESSAPARPNRQVEQMLTGSRTVAVLARPEVLPFDARSIDVAILPHTLDFAEDPRQVLREVSRVLSPEGHVVILGFNPLSLWGVRRLLAARPRTVPWSANFLRLTRIRDWLVLLDFELTHGSMLYYRPPMQHENIMDRLYFLEKAGDRWWPMMAAVYLVVAKKRVPGMTPLPVSWKTRQALGPAAEPAVRGALHGRFRRRLRRHE